MVDGGFECRQAAGRVNQLHDRCGDSSGVDGGIHLVARGCDGLNPGGRVRPAVRDLAAATATAATPTQLGGGLGALGNGDPPDLRASLQNLPDKLPGRAPFQLGAQWQGIMVIGEFKCLARLHLFKPVEDHGVALKAGFLAQINAADKRGWHGKVFQWAWQVHPNNLKMHQ
jgi:hypothetical protein